jgi:hypothetical protein
MKKIFVLAMIVFTFLSGNAQQPRDKKCKARYHKVCRVDADNKKTCYNRPNSQSFDVCKNEYGYYICCETPGEYNTTYSKAAQAIGTASQEARQAWTGHYPVANMPQPQAQPQPQAKECKVRYNKVCRVDADNKKTCYKRPNSQSFQVCKNEYGYYICCETPAKHNTTYLGK